MSQFPPPGPPPPSSQPSPGPPAVDGGSPASRHAPAAASSGPPWALIAILGLVLVATAVVGVVLLTRAATVGSLETGDCLRSSALAAGESTLDDLDVVECTSAHDGEVVAVVTLDEEADETAACGSEVPTLDVLAAAGVEVRPLTEPGEDTAGDKVACVARRVDGAALTGRVGQP